MDGSESQYLATPPRETAARRGGGASRRLKIGVIGFGNFGQFIAKKFVKHHDVVGMGRGDHSIAAKNIGASKKDTIRWMSLYQLHTAVLLGLDAMVRFVWNRTAW